MNNKSYKLLSLLIIPLMGINFIKSPIVGASALVEKDTTGSVVSSFVTNYSSSNYNGEYKTPTASYVNEYKELVDGEDINLFNSDLTVNDNFKFNVYIGGSTENPKIRNYHSANSNYYLFLKYPNNKTAGQEGAYLEISTIHSGISLNSINFDLNTYKQNLNLKVSSDGSSWTTEFDSSKDTLSSQNSLTFTTENVHYIRIINVPSTDTIATGSNFLSFVKLTVNYTYTEDVYTLTFDSNGGTEIESQNVPASSLPTKPEDPIKPTSDGVKYVFDGWYLDGELYNFDTLLTGDTTLVAHYIESTDVSMYTMTFETNGGTEIDPIQTEEGTSFIKPEDPTKVPEKPDRYINSFAGWYLDEALTEEYDWDTFASDDLTLYAKWSVTYTDNPTGTQSYSLIDGVVNNDTSWNEPYAGTSSTDVIREITLDSYETFDQNKTNEHVIFHSYGNSSASSGMYFNNYWSPIFKNASGTISLVDTTKVITYARVVLEAWSSVSWEMQLYANNDLETVVDTENTTTSVSKAIINNCLQASFDPSDGVTSISFSTTDKTYWICVRYIYLAFADNPNIEAAETYSSTFLDAGLCDGGVTAPNVDTWNDLKDSFIALDDGAKELLRSATANESGSVIEQAVARYDYIVGKYGTSTYDDFMERNPSALPNGIRSVFTISIDNKGMMISLLTVVSIISLLSFGLTLVYKRKYSK